MASEPVATADDTAETWNSERAPRSRWTRSATVAAAGTGLSLTLPGTDSDDSEEDDDDGSGDGGGCVAAAGRQPRRAGANGNEGASTGRTRCNTAARKRRRLRPRSPYRRPLRSPFQPPTMQQFTTTRSFISPSTQHDSLFSFFLHCRYVFTLNTSSFFFFFFFLHNIYFVSLFNRRPGLSIRFEEGRLFLSGFRNVQFERNTRTPGEKDFEVVCEFFEMSIYLTSKDPALFFIPSISLQQYE